jgi:hypothetical protein
LSAEDLGLSRADLDALADDLSRSAPSPTRVRVLAVAASSADAISPDVWRAPAGGARVIVALPGVSAPAPPRGADSPRLVTLASAPATAPTQPMDMMQLSGDAARDGVRLLDLLRALLR